MKKIVAFAGSPRKEGFSRQLMDRLLAGAEAAGAEVVVYDLNADGIKGCQGCFYCRKHDACAQQDVLQPMYGDIREACAVVATFPLYFGQISGQGKIWLDRMYPMFQKDFSPRFPGKKAVTIFAQAKADPAVMQGAIDSVNGLIGGYGWELIRSFLIAGTVDPQYRLEESLLAEAYQVGQQLV
ncbi:MAG: flavodoxin family protein [Oscillospiraceae bacterium]|nr:flavodoxin family protein [Oscillospiraceae bacterium]